MSDLNVGTISRIMILIVVHVFLISVGHSVFLINSVFLIRCFLWQSSLHFALPYGACQFTSLISPENCLVYFQFVYLQRLVICFVRNGRVDLCSGALLKVEQLFGVLSVCSLPLDYPFSASWLPRSSNMYRTSLICIKNSRLVCSMWSASIFVSLFSIHAKQWFSVWCSSSSLPPTPIFAQLTLRLLYLQFVFIVSLCLFALCGLRQFLWAFFDSCKAVVFCLVFFQFVLPVCSAICVSNIDLCTVVYLQFVCTVFCNTPCNIGRLVYLQFVCILVPLYCVL